MEKPKYFRSKTAGDIPLPLFFPDATRAFVKTLDSIDIKNTKTPGVLVNTYHLIKNPGKALIKDMGGVGRFMKWEGAIISDSGGFQIMSLAKSKGLGGKITDKGVTFKLQGENSTHLTPEDSINFQFTLKTDLIVVLDDFTPPSATWQYAKETVERTILWAKKCKKEYEKLLKRQKIESKNRPYLIAVTQGGTYQDLRELCTKKLVEIGFDGIGYGGWPLRTNENGQNMEFDYESARSIKENVPDNYFLYGLGIGKPEEITNLVKMGFQIFDCVLPTRDARHRRLYIYDADTIRNIDLTKSKFYSYFVPNKEKYYHDKAPVSTACDCLLCKNYSRAYLAHLFREKEMSAMRLASIHNLRFYSILMEKLRSTYLQTQK